MDSNGASMALLGPGLVQATLGKQSFLTLRQRHKAKQLHLPSQMNEEEYSTYFSMPTLQGSFDAFRYITHPTYERDLAKYRCYFHKLLSKMNQSKTVVCAFSVFTLTFMAASEFIALENMPTESKESLFLFELCFLDQTRLTQLVSFALSCLGLTIGILLACYFQPERHLFLFNRRNTFFISAVIFFIFIILDIAIIIIHQCELLLLMPICATIKSILTGFLAVFLLYTLFDIKINPINQQEAKTYVRTYMVMFTVGFLSALTVYFYYFSDLIYYDEYYLELVVMSIFLCRIFFSLNCAILLILIWYGAASIHQLNIVKEIEFEDFLAQYTIDPACSRLVTLNCVCLACQIEPGHKVNHLNEDNFSIRTVKEWRKACFSVAGLLLFSLAFYAEISHLVGSTLWYADYYPNYLTTDQIMSAQLLLFASLLGTRVFMLFLSELKPLICISRLESSLQKCLKFATVYLVHLLANLSQLFLVELGYIVVLITNILYGISLGLMLETVSKFISSYMTITSMMIQYSIMFSIFCVSILAYVNFYFLDNLQEVSPILYINLTCSLLSLLIILIVSRCQCLVSKNSFDLIEMNSFSTNSIDHSKQMSSEVSCCETPVLHDKRKVRSESELRCEHSSKDGSTRRSSNSQLYCYRNDHQSRKQSTASIIAYRIKFRFESIVSSLNLSDNNN